jgi:hypothetical protein
MSKGSLLAMAHTDKFLVFDNGGIELDTHGFSMPSPTGTDILVRGGFHTVHSSGVSYGCFNYSLILFRRVILRRVSEDNGKVLRNEEDHLEKHVFSSPEA